MPKKKPFTQSTPSRKKAESLDAIEGFDEMVASSELHYREHEERVAHKGAKAVQPGRIKSNPEDELGERIQQTRESMRLTQGELAALTTSLDSEEKGISRAVISLYEGGKNRPSPRELRLLCEALKVTPNYLIYGKDDPFDTLSDYERLGTLERKEPEGFAWMAYIMSTAHHNHYDAVMKLILDLSRGWDRSFDKGLQDKANTMLLDMADKLRDQLDRRTKLKQSSDKK